MVDPTDKMSSRASLGASEISPQYASWLIASGTNDSASLAFDVDIAKNASSVQPPQPTEVPSSPPPSEQSEPPPGQPRAPVSSESSMSPGRHSSPAKESCATDSEENGIPSVKHALQQMSHELSRAMLQWTHKRASLGTLKEAAVEVRRLADSLQRVGLLCEESLDALRVSVGPEEDDEKIGDAVIAKSVAGAEALLSIWVAGSRLSMECGESEEAAKCFHNAAKLLTRCASHPVVVKHFGENIAAFQSELEHHSELLFVARALLRSGVVAPLSPHFPDIAASCCSECRLLLSATSQMTTSVTDGNPALAEEKQSALIACCAIVPGACAKFLRQSSLVSLDAGKFDHALVAANEALRLETSDTSTESYMCSLFLLLISLYKCSKAGIPVGNVEELEVIVEAYISHPGIAAHDRLMVCRQLGQYSDRNVISRINYLGYVESVCGSASGQIQLHCAKLFTEMAMLEATDPDETMNEASSGLCRVLDTIDQAKTKESVIFNALAPSLWQLAQASYRRARFEETLRWLSCCSKLVGIQRYCQKAIALAHWRARRVPEALQQVQGEIADVDFVWCATLRLLCLIQAGENNKALACLRVLLEHRDFSADAVEALLVEVSQIPVSHLVLECLQALVQQLFCKRMSGDHAGSLTKCCHEAAVQLATVAESCDVPYGQLANCLDMCIKSFSHKESATLDGQCAPEIDTQIYIKQAFAIAWRNASKLFFEGKQWMECAWMLERAWDLLHLFDGTVVREARLQCAMLLARTRLQSIAFHANREDASHMRQQAAEHASQALLSARQIGVSDHAKQFLAALAEAEFELRLGIPHWAEAAVGVDDPDLPMEYLWRMAARAEQCPGESAAATRCLLAYLRKASDLFQIVMSSGTDSVQVVPNMQQIGIALRKVVSIQSGCTAKLQALQEVLAWLEGVTCATALNAVSADLDALARYSWNYGAHLHRDLPEKAIAWLQVAARLFKCLPAAVDADMIDKKAASSAAMEWFDRHFQSTPCAVALVGCSQAGG